MASSREIVFSPFNRCASATISFSLSSAIAFSLFSIALPLITIIIEHGYGDHLADIDHSAFIEIEVRVMMRIDVASIRHRAADDGEAARTLEQIIAEVFHARLRRNVVHIFLTHDFLLRPSNARSLILIID